MTPAHDSRFAVLAAMLLLLATPAAAKSAKAKSPAKPAAISADAGQPDPVALTVGALAAQSRGENELALRLAQSAIVADPARPASYDVLGDIYAAANEPDYARHYYDQALSIDPADAAAQKAIADLDRATDKRAANLSPDGPKTGTP